VERLGSGMRWAEGPVYFPAGRYLLVSDVPKNRVMRYDEVTGVWGGSVRLKGPPRQIQIDVDRQSPSKSTRYVHFSIDLDSPR
jgi:sugar lactone lactonase YvrE